MRTVVAASVLAAAVAASLAFSRDRGPQTPRLEMRDLWGEHDLSLRHYLVSAMDRHPDEASVLQRLERNTDEIAASLKPRYGADAARKRSALLRERVRAGAGNAGAIAGLLSGLNLRHGERVGRALEARAREDWAGALEAFDEGLEDILRLADYLSEDH